MNIIQELYDSEISSAISSFWDGGFEWRLGNEWDVRARGDCSTLMGSVAELTAAALEHYPDSDFAKRYTPAAEVPA